MYSARSKPQTVNSGDQERSLFVHWYFYNCVMKTSSQYKDTSLHLPSPALPHSPGFPRLCPISTLWSDLNSTTTQGLGSEYDPQMPFISNGIYSDIHLPLLSLVTGPRWLLPGVHSRSSTIAPSFLMPQPQ